MWSSRPSCLTSTNASPSRAPPLVFKYRPARGPVRISAYPWPGTALVVSFSAAALSWLENEVVVAEDFSDADATLGAWFAAVMPWRRDVSTRIGLISASAIRLRNLSEIFGRPRRAARDLP